MRRGPPPWEQLGRDERMGLASLAMFARPATVDAFEAVAGPHLEGDPVRVARALLRKGLARREPAAERIRPVDSLRADARRFLDAAAARTRVEDGHASYFLARAEQACARSYGSAAERALDDLQADAPDLLAAFASTVARAPALAARIVLSLGDLVLFRDGGGVGAIPLRSAVFAEARLAADASGDAELRARTRILAARVSLELGQGEDAEAGLLDAVALAEAARLPATLADARRALGWAWLALGRSREAAAVLDDALKAHREAANVRGEADALAARGLVACLEASMGAAALEPGWRRLEVAHALHRGAGDAIRREKVVAMARLVGLSLEAEDAVAAAPEERARLLRASAQGHREAGRFWREALDLFQLAELTDGEARSAALGAARRAADEARVPAELAEALERRPPGAGAAVANAGGWVVGSSARWLCAPGGERVSLARSGAMRRVLDALVESRLRAPGAPWTADALFAIGWPGERARHESSLLRVYTTIRRLRRLGLEGALLTRDDGYLLDPRAAFSRDDDGAAP